MMRKKISAPAIDEDLLNYSDDKEGYVKDVVSSTVNIRKIVPPKLKWQEQIYHSMINWLNEINTEPSFIPSLSNQQLSDIIKTPLVVLK